MSIEFIDVVKRFGTHTVLDGVTLSVPTGEVHFVVGPSGTGKSVLMKHAIGLLKPDSGEVHVDGMRVDTMDEPALFAVRRRLGYVFQHPTLLDALTLQENVAMPLVRREGRPRREAKAIAARWLQRVGVAEADAWPADVGDGVKKRAAIARALALEPRYVIYDEPTTGLDPINARRIDRLIRRLADETGVTAIVVSHDLQSIFGIADRVAFLYRGRIHSVLSAEAFRESSDPLLRQFATGAPEGPLEL